MLLALRGADVKTVGSGAVGGYFRARLTESGADVHFPVRPARKKLLAKFGLKISSPHGDFACQPRTVSSDELKANFGLIMVCVKSYQLNQAMLDFSGAVGADTAILPLLNGISHLSALGDRFDRDQVLGGMCLITAVADRQSGISHLLKPHELVFGELRGGKTGRSAAIHNFLSLANLMLGIATRLNWKCGKSCRARDQRGRNRHDARIHRRYPCHPRRSGSHPPDPLGSRSSGTSGGVSAAARIFQIHEVAADRGGIGG